MSTVLTAAKLEPRSGTGCRSDERWITLRGPNGGEQKVKLTGDAIVQMERWINGERLAADMLAYGTGWKEQHDRLFRDCQRDKAELLAALAGMLDVNGDDPDWHKHPAHAVASALIAKRKGA